MSDDFDYFTNLCGLINKTLVKELDDEVDDPKPKQKRAAQMPDEVEEEPEPAMSDLEKAKKKLLSRAKQQGQNKRERDDKRFNKKDFDDRNFRGENKGGDRRKFNGDKNDRDFNKRSDRRKRD